MSLFLSQSERTKFADWCEKEAKSTDGLIQQMEKINIPQEVIKRKRIEVIACLTIANLLRSIEDG